MNVPTLYLDTSVIGGYFDAGWMTLKNTHAEARRARRQTAMKELDDFTGAGVERFIQVMTPPHREPPSPLRVSASPREPWETHAEARRARRITR